MDRDAVRTARNYISRSSYPVALTGAGVSAGSGIPGFRGRNGIWQRHDPALAHIDAFHEDPHRVWLMAREFIALALAAEPNAAHRSLASMEQTGILNGLITQNVDGLHQRAGSRRVTELHGNITNLRCAHCALDYEAVAFDLGAGDPVCPECGSVLKPGMVFFGEMLPFPALMEARLLASSTDLMIVIGTSAVVNPAAELPFIARLNRAKIIEINTVPTGLTNAITDVFLQGRAEELVPLLAER